MRHVADTGPMFQKYNSVLRGIKAEPESRMAISLKKLTRGNTYTTTLHCINSVIVKLGKLTKAQKVYRGISLKGGELSLPATFWNRNSFGVTAQHLTNLREICGSPLCAHTGGSP